MCRKLFFGKVSWHSCCRFTHFGQWGCFDSWNTLNRSQICYIDYPKLFGFKYASISYILADIWQHSSTVCEHVFDRCSHFIFRVHACLHTRAHNSIVEIPRRNDFLYIFVCVWIHRKAREGECEKGSSCRRVRSSNCIQAPTFMHCFFFESMRLLQRQWQRQISPMPHHVGVWATWMREICG